MGEKNVWIKVKLRIYHLKFSSVIVLDKNGKCIFYSRSDLFTSL